MQHHLPLRAHSYRAGGPSKAPNTPPHPAGDRAMARRGQTMLLVAAVTFCLSLFTGPVGVWMGAILAGLLGGVGLGLAFRAYRDEDQARAAHAQAWEIHRVQSLIDARLDHGALLRSTVLLLDRWVDRMPQELPSEGTWSWIVHWKQGKEGMVPHSIRLVRKKGTPRPDGATNRIEPRAGLTPPGLIAGQQGTLLPWSSVVPHLTKDEHLRIAALPRTTPLMVYAVSLGPFPLDSAHQRMAFRAHLQQCVALLTAEPQATPASGANGTQSGAATARTEGAGTRNHGQAEASPRPSTVPAPTQLLSALARPA